MEPGRVRGRGFEPRTFGISDRRAGHLLQPRMCSSQREIRTPMTALTGRRPAVGRAGKGTVERPDGESNSDLLFDREVSVPVDDRGGIEPVGIEPTKARYELAMRPVH